MPFGLNHPLWIADRPIDPARHVFVHRVPEPGGMAGIEDLIGEIGSRPLDQSVPLWEVHVTEPYDGKRIAVVAKMHHALADGGAANALLGAVTDAARQEAGRAGAPGARADAVAAGRSCGWPCSTPSPRSCRSPRCCSRRCVASRACVKVRRRSTVRGAPADPRRSAHVAERAAAPRRNFATASLPLDDVRAVGKAHGRDGQRRGPGAGLAARCGAGSPPAASARGPRCWPASRSAPTPPTSGPRLGGNRVSNLFTTLATDIDDPVRAGAHDLGRTTRESKLVQQTLGPDLLREWVQFTPPVPMSLAMRGYSRMRAAALHTRRRSTSSSRTSAGRATPLTIANATLVDLFSVGPILEGIGLNVTAWSYDGRLNFSLLGCPDLVDDLRPIAAGLAPALDELRSAVAR